MIDAKNPEHDLSRAFGTASPMLGSVAHALDGAAPALQNAAERLSDLAHEGMSSVRDSTQRLSDQARRASHQTALYIQQDPLKSVLIAAAIGAGAMALISLFSRSGGR